MTKKSNRAGSRVSLALLLLVLCFGANMPKVLGAGMQAGTKAHEAIAARLGKPASIRTGAQGGI